MMKVQRPWLHQLFSSLVLLRRRLQFVTLSTRRVSLKRVLSLSLLCFSCDDRSTRRQRPVRSTSAQQPFQQSAVIFILHLKCKAEFQEMNVTAILLSHKPTALLVTIQVYGSYRWGRSEPCVQASSFFGCILESLSKLFFKCLACCDQNEFDPEHSVHVLTHPSCLVNNSLWFISSMKKTILWESAYEIIFFLQ